MKINILFALLLSSNIFASEVSFIDSSATTVGETITITTEINNALDLYAFQFDLNFDSTILSVIDIQQGSLFSGSDNFISGIIDNTAGTITFIADTLNGTVQGIYGSGSLATFTFAALSSGTSLLSLSNPIFLDSNLSDITTNVTIQNSSINVTSAVPVPSSILLFSSGLLALLASYKRQYK